MKIDAIDLFTFQQSLEFFGFRRTDYNVGKTFQGVQTPSQVMVVEHGEFHYNIV